MGSSSSSSSEMERAIATTDRPGARTWKSWSSHLPSFLIGTTFLDQACGFGSTHGVNPEMRERLQSAEAAVRAHFDGLDPDRRIDPSTGRGNASFSQWCAIAGPHLCWRANASHHSAGSAIDINTVANPPVVACSGLAAEGSAGAGLAGMRSRALGVYDRALQFAGTPDAVADLSGRRPNESTQSVWTRFKTVSDALVHYLSFAVHAEPAEVSRVAIENADAAADDALVATIPEGERLNLDRGIAQLEDLFASPAFQARHPVWSTGARAQYLRILRDYEQARIPMVIGDPSPTPSMTRNPARGFLNLRSEIVAALCDQGLRWGACDVDTPGGATPPNGSMTHFDLADDGGYPEIHSLLRFG